MQAQRVGRFLGVNLRQDRLSLADQDMARAINADLHRHPGIVLGRRGTQRVTTSALGTAGDNTIRWIQRLQGRRYTTVGDDAFRDTTSINTGGMSKPLSCNWVAFRPLNDNTTWAFLMGAMDKDDGTNTRDIGSAVPNAPTTAIGAAGVLTGDYTAKYTYARVVSGSVAYETNPSSAGTTRTLSSQKLDVTVTASGDAQITNIRIYRTQAGGSSFLFETQVSNTNQTVNLNTADSSLGAAVEEDNDQPHPAGYGVIHQGHLFLLQVSAVSGQTYPNALFWSKRFRPEQFPTDNLLYIGEADDPLESAFSLGGFLGVFTRKTKYRVLGNVSTGFAAVEALSHRGVVHPSGAVLTENGCIFLSRDGVFATDFLSQDTPLSQAIEPLFSGETINDYLPLNFSGITRPIAYQSGAAVDLSPNIAMAWFKNRLYLAYPSGSSTTADMLAVWSRETQRWYFYQLETTALTFEESENQLTFGTADGHLYALESPPLAGATAEGAYTITIEGPDRAGASPFQLKQFRWLRVDCEGATFTVQVWIDGVLRQTLSLTGARTRGLFRLLPGLIGFTYRLVISWAQAGNGGEGKFYEAECYYEPMEVV
jgi:hypothetical protein